MLLTSDVSDLNCIPLVTTQSSVRDAGICDNSLIRYIDDIGILRVTRMLGSTKDTREK